MVNNLTKKQWEQELEKAFDEGFVSHVHHRVYETGGLIIKASISGDEITEREYKLGRFLFRNGVHVPEMYNLVRCRRGTEERLYIIMQKIEGIHIIEKNETRKIENIPAVKEGGAIKKLRREIKKVLRLGIYPADSDWCENSIFNPKERKVYLIDFEGYRKKEEGLFEKWFYESIKKDNFIRDMIDGGM